ncbi:hypothetical protein RD1_2125 [Roseobacter denitrificans OCh 114]|uniref:Uncharacterized protein n=1 Tax=Roseobacter denitrificans (strain ATCC 33942 / OCh 114) TaxID=375451 RepID=Q167X2_ROSDO|nr:hypothetical protein RD1_2125 [Roseobacter denitrificans OCh 114]
MDIDGWGFYSVVVVAGVVALGVVVAGVVVAGVVVPPPTTP